MSVGIYRKSLPIGTLIEDMGRAGVIINVMKAGNMDTEVHAIKWRNNYEICYYDGNIQIIGEVTFNRLVARGDIKIISE